MLQKIVKIYIGIVLILLKKEFVVFVVGDGAVQKEKPIIPVNKSPHLKILADWQSHTNLVDASRKKGPSNRSPLKGNHKTENDSRSVHFFFAYMFWRHSIVSWVIRFGSLSMIIKILLIERWNHCCGRFCPIKSIETRWNVYMCMCVCACVHLNVCICA